MKKFLNNDQGNAVPILLFLATIISVGALYTLFFIYIFFPGISPLVPASDSKTLIMMFLYAIPLVVMVVGVISLIMAGLKRDVVMYQ